MRAIPRLSSRTSRTSFNWLEESLKRSSLSRACASSISLTSTAGLLARSDFTSIELTDLTRNNLGLHRQLVCGKGQCLSCKDLINSPHLKQDGSWSDNGDVVVNSSLSFTHWHF